MTDPTSPSKNRPPSSPLFGHVFQVMVMLNMVLAIIMDVYAEAAKKEQQLKISLQLLGG